MAKLTLQQTLDTSLKTAKSYIDTELAKKANLNHGTHLTLGTGSENAAAGNHTHNYAGSSSAGGAANSVKTNLVVKLNGGTTEGTNLFTFNGSAAKTVNITPASIGALPTTGGTISGGSGLTVVTSGNVDKALTIQRNNSNEQTKIYQTDTALFFDMTNDETAAKIQFRMSATDIEAGDGTGGFTNSTVTFTGSKSGSTVTATTFSGNATSATKATQDSAGQQINKTYIKGLSVSGKTITYTKGDDTTGTITTQDTNTTYSTGTASTAGLTKLYTGTGTATDGTMTQNAIKSALDGKSATSHTHTSIQKENLYGLTVSLNDYTLSDGTTHIKYYYCPNDSGGQNITGRPNDNAKNAFSLKVELIRWASATDYISKQTYIRGSERIIYVRYCTGGSWSEWEKVYTSAQKPTASDVGALSTSGGTISGAINANIGGGEAGFYITNGTAKTMVYSSVIAGDHIFGGNNNSSSDIIDFIRIGANKLQYETGGNVYNVYHAGNKQTTINGLSLWTGTQAQYDALSSKSSTTLYFITG